MNTLEKKLRSYAQVRESVHKTTNSHVVHTTDVYWKRQEERYCWKKAIIIQRYQFTKSHVAEIANILMRLCSNETKSRYMTFIQNAQYGEKTILDIFLVHNPNREIFWGNFCSLCTRKLIRDNGKMDVAK